MPYRTHAIPAIILWLMVFIQAANAATTTIQVDATNTIPNVIANAIIADGEGDDWTEAVLRIDLTGGSVYNEPGFGSDGAPSSAFIGLVPTLKFDTYVGIIDDPTAGFPGGAGDISCEETGTCFTLEPPNIFISWFNTRVTDTAPVQIANISLTDDAAGVWTLTTSYTNGLVESSGVVIDGVMVPEPGALTVLGVGVLGLMRRRRSVGNTR
jgi:PEP-CTERM motif